MPSHKNGPIRIDFAQNLGEEDIRALVQEINEIYLEEEGAIWPNDGSYERINKHEVLQLMSNKEIIVARFDDRIIGTIKLYEREDRWYFGLLTTHRLYRGLGTATQLIKFVEDYLRSKDISELYIEIIFSEGVDLPKKQSLKDWYKLKGFVPNGRIDFSKVDSEKALLLKHQAYFEIMKKTLS